MAWPSLSDSVRRRHGSPLVYVDFADAVAVSTETPLMALTEIGPLNEKVFFTVRNHHATLAAMAYVDRSESGVVNSELRQVKLIQPLSEVAFTFDDSPEREVARMFALSASGDPEGAYAAVTVSWQVRVQLRRDR